MPGPVVIPGRYAFTSGAVTAGLGVLYATPPPLRRRVAPSRIISQPSALTSSVKDDFNSGTINTVVWAQNYGTLRQENGRAEVWSDASTVNYSGFATEEMYSLDTLSAQIFPHPSTGSTNGDGNTAFWFQNGDVDGTDIGFYVDAVQNVIWFASRTGYFDGGATIIPYDPVAHLWCRLSLVGGTVIWETSPDGSTWTTRRTMAAPTWLLYERRGRIMMEAHQNDGTASWGGFDNLNLLPGPAVSPSAGAASGTGTAFDAVVGFSRLNTWDAGAVGTNVTVANSANSGDSLTGIALGGDGSITYISPAYRGAASVRVTSGASGAIAFVEQATGQGSDQPVYVRVRFRMPVIPPDTTGIRCIVVADSTGAFQGEIRLSSTGKVQLRSGAGVTVNNSTATYAAGDWIDVALAILTYSTTVGVVEMRLWDNTGTLAETVTSTATLDTIRSGGATKVQVGMIRSAITNFSVDLDDLAVSNLGYPAVPIAVGAANPEAEAATATGLASDAIAATDGQADSGVATGLATNASVATDALATAATGVATGHAATTAAIINADAATASGQAAPASATLLANADPAAGTATASDATVTTASETQATAAPAEGAGSAADGAPTVDAQALSASAPGAAASASTALQPGALPAQGTATAASASTALLAGALDASAAGSAEDATVSTLAVTEAPAESPAAAGTAGDAVSSSSALADAPAAAGSAPNATASTSGQAGAATSAATASPATADLTVAADPAVATGLAADATVAAESSVAAPADVAMAIGAAESATVATSVPAGAATGLATAGDAAGSVAALPAAPVATGSATDATVSTLVQTDGQAEAAIGAGSAANATVLISASAGAASAAGSALGTVGQVGALALAALGAGLADAVLARLEAVALAAEGIGEAADTDTSGATSSPSAWLVTETQDQPARVTVTAPPLISHTHQDEATMTRSDVLVTTTTVGS